MTTDKPKGDIDKTPANEVFAQCQNLIPFMRILTDCGDFMPCHDDPHYNSAYVMQLKSVDGAEYTFYQNHARSGDTSEYTVLIRKSGNDVTWVGIPIEQKEGEEIPISVSVTSTVDLSNEMDVSVNFTEGDSQVDSRVQELLEHLHAIAEPVLLRFREEHIKRQRGGVIDQLGGLAPKTGGVEEI